MKSLLLYSSSILLSLGVSQGFAQEIKTNSFSGLDINGYFDFYSLSSPQSHAAAGATSGPQVTEGKYFDRNVNQLTLNMAEISIKKTAGKVSLKTDLAMGEMVDQLSGGATAFNEPTRNLTQAILSYSPSERASISVGKFYTHLGFEVTKAKDNLQYSRSFTFNYAIPFWHQGISFGYKLIPDVLSSTIYVVNAWDGRNSQEQNKSSSTGLNLNYSGAKDFAVNYNYLGGAEATESGRREVHEVNGSYNINSSLTLAFDYVAGSQKKVTTIDEAKWSALTLYFKAVVNDTYTISPRYELFDDSDNGFAISGGLSAPGLKQKITSWTLSNTFNLGDGLEARIEFRTDKSDSSGFFKSKTGADSDRQETYLAAFLYSF